MPPPVRGLRIICDLGISSLHSNYYLSASHMTNTTSHHISTLKFCGSPPSPHVCSPNAPLPNLSRPTTDDLSTRRYDVIAQSLMFLKAVVRFRDSLHASTVNDDDKFVLLTDIVDKYVKCGSPFEVNIGSKTKGDILENTTRETFLHLPQVCMSISGWCGCGNECS